MKQNCLTRALDQWDEYRDEFRLWYNSDHVISLQKNYNAESLKFYLPLNDFGFDYFARAFNLLPKYCILLREYLDFEVKNEQPSK